MFKEAVFLATFNKALVDALAAPIRVKFPHVDLWWLIYPAIAFGFVLGWYSELNLLAEYIPNVMVGRILTSASIGLGSNLIHQVFNLVPEGVGLLRAKRNGYA